MGEVKELIQAVRQGEIDPLAAVAAFENPAKHISEVPIDDLAVDVLDCGFPTLNDYMVFKKKRGELIIFGARPSMGKSAFLFQVMHHVAKTGNVLGYTLEMDKESLKARMIAAESGYGLQKILRGEVKVSQLQAANARLSLLNYYIDDRSGLDINTLIASTLSFHKKRPLSLVVVDYLQLIKSGNRVSRNEEVGDVSMQLKELAKQLKCPVLVAAQLNRKCVERGQMAMARGKSPDYRPELADLRESGNVEQDADGVIFLSRHEFYHPNFRQGQADISIAKQRNGPTGQEVFKWLGASTTFVDPRSEGGI